MSSGRRYSTSTQLSSEVRNESPIKPSLLGRTSGQFHCSSSILDSLLKCLVVNKVILNTRKNVYGPDDRSQACTNTGPNNQRYCDLLPKQATFATTTFTVTKHS
jgi:hypothetical protein